MSLRNSLFAGLFACAMIAPGAAVMAVTNVYTIADPQESSIANGYDIAKIEFTLGADDSLTVEIFPYGTPGDADGDGNPDASSNPAIIDGIGVGSLERIFVGMVCDFDGVTCIPNFSVTYTNNMLTTSPVIPGLSFTLEADRYVLLIPSVTDLKLAVLGYTPPSVTFGAFNFSASFTDLEPDDFVPNRDPATNALVCEQVDLVPPVVEAPGTGTIGYWKNHPTEWPEGCDVSLPGSDTDPEVFAMNVLKAPVRGDKTVAMGKQLVATLLNICAGNDSSCIDQTVMDAVAWLELNGPVFSGQKHWNGGDVIQELLDDYNNGLLCAPHRD